MSAQRLPPGWNEDRVREAASRYDEMSDEDFAAKLDASPDDVSPAEAKSWLLSFSKRPEAVNFALAAKAIERLSDKDVLQIFSEAKTVMAGALKPAR